MTLPKLTRPARVIRMVLLGWLGFAALAAAMSIQLAHGAPLAPPAASPGPPR